MAPKIICLIPVKNEAWILERCLQSASIWADHIIVADQGSTDGSIEIAKSFNKVIFVDNSTNEDFNEYKMRSPLFKEADKIEGPKVLISVDADEILTPNFDSPEWDTILNSKPGTIISLPLINLLPDGKYWSFGEIWCGYIDDGTPYASGSIHVPRTIMPSGHDVLICQDIQLLHYKYLDWRRMQDRNRWYQCYELINKINDPIAIYRRYHSLDGIGKEKIHDIPAWWQTEYAKHGIEITSILYKQEPRWNKQIVDYLNKYGANFFRHLNIWDVNWNDIADGMGIPHNQSFKDPRRRWEKAINRWLINTQSKQGKSSVHLLEKLFRRIYN